jgi:hypothetical protein
MIKMWSLVQKNKRLKFTAVEAFSANTHTHTKETELFHSYKLIFLKMLLLE